MLVLCRIEYRRGSNCSSQRIPSQSKMQNNCLCRFNNLHKRHKNQIEKGRGREMTVKCETYNNYKANQVERHPDAAKGDRAESVAHYAKQPRIYTHSVQGCVSL